MSNPKAPNLLSYAGACYHLNRGLTIRRDAWPTDIVGIRHEMRDGEKQLVYAYANGDTDICRLLKADDLLAEDWHKVDTKKGGAK